MTIWSDRGLRGSKAADWGWYIWSETAAPHAESKFSLYAYILRLEVTAAVDQLQHRS